MNGLRVRKIYSNDYGVRLITLGTCRHCNKDIESIVTKEQFDSIKYVLGGKEE